MWSFGYFCRLRWGRLAGRQTFSNPLELVYGGFKDRPEDSVGGEVGGELRGKSFFRGQIGVFGGFRYSLRSFPLDFIAEYSSDDYRREASLKSIADSSPLSFGVEWQLSKGFSIAASLQQDSFVGLTIRSTVDFNDNRLALRAFLQRRRPGRPRSSPKSS